MFDSFLRLLEMFVKRFGMPKCVVYAPSEKIYFCKPLPKPYENIPLLEDKYLIQGAWIIPRIRKVRKQVYTLMRQRRLANV